ncbi:Ribosomal RNA-processing protein 17 [Taphrina deformans PYCC 5710]|uniref:Ribosomal RNA-processing protein 17 n=1 Tax=Taphrina deformans (strain PYCC 5710 / ATCC 11124 / CBS 356.35 / IMI 108563 / JCM 9778 / NBRC 8474) TaxID=1097556 RepID=R4X6M4_TAPDE|nr:Ribosomal RNA-processing protein 17 [Taphrina deformans PYCC 5710]|eukprot:CCG80836.1 Ribosomal RNA-processing protein 17 [Taphrina deformans PYCC 5710]
MGQPKKKSSRNNTDRLSHGKKIAALKRATKASRAAECTFDPVARTEFLTGFHKRKVERRNKALQKGKEEARAAQLAMRADLRRQRKDELRQRMEAYRADLGLDSDGEEVDHDAESWFGFDGEEDDDDDDAVKGTGEKKKNKKKGLWMVNEYEDDEKTVSVVVEEMS